MFPFGDLGPATIIWDVDGVALDLGPTHGGVVFKDEVKYKEIFEDGKGETPADAVFTGRVCTLEAKMTRSSLAQLNAILPSSTLAASVLTMKTSVGTQMKALAKKVTVKRLIDDVPTTDPAGWLTLLYAYPVAKPNFTFDVDSQRTVDVTFLCFPSDVSGEVGKMWKIGE